MHNIFMVLKEGHQLIPGEDPSLDRLCLMRSFYCRQWVVRLLEWSLRGFCKKDFTENLENVILQSSLSRFTLLLIKWMEYKIEGGFEWKTIYTE